MTHWDSAQYLKFADERTRPAHDLLARVPLDRVTRAVDLGCGPGTSTILLRRRWPDADLVGVDNSEQMLERARADFAAESPAIRFEPGDIADWESNAPAPDLVFSNAAIQWVGDHEALFPRLLEQPSKGGVLAIQMPHNQDAPSHAIMREVAALPQWRARILDAREANRVHAAEWYHDLLAPRAAALEIWETEYFHVLPDIAAIVEWVKGTGLRPFLEPLDPAERARFLALYAAGLASAYPVRPNGKVIFPFRRLFIVATR